MNVQLMPIALIMSSTAETRPVPNEQENPILRKAPARRVMVIYRMALKKVLDSSLLYMMSSWLVAIFA